uniref:Putative epimerase YddE/YHI9, PhzF superfamily n=1 Tax=Piromyces sp. TaxID=45796 RepID=A0A2S1TZH1_PIRSP|nr:putative epimerase YddE/YHI9, PhzF superfamily [Piromyces sp.]
MKQYIVDAFAEELFSGNPAAVLPCKKMPSSEMMQKIAIENNYSETAFVVKRSPGQYDLKWFTPGGEIDLCGHATLGTSFVIDNFVDKGVEEMHFHTLSGELIVKKEAAGYTMNFPVGKIKPIPITESILEASSHLATEAYYDGGDMVAIVSSSEELKNFKPDAELIKKLDGLGFILTAKSEEDRFDFVSRCFYPKLELLEDPVTGRAHTYLTPIWTEKLGKKVMTAKQISKRGGVMTVRQDGDRVYLTGHVQLFMEGDIPFDL